MEATTELLDDLPQSVCVFLDDPSCFLGARDLGRRLILTRQRFFGRFHTVKVGAPPNGLVDLSHGFGTPFTVGELRTH